MVEPSPESGVKEAYVCVVRLFTPPGRKHSNPLCLNLETESTVCCATVEEEGENADWIASDDHVDFDLDCHYKTAEKTRKWTGPILSGHNCSDDTSDVVGTDLLKTRIHRRNGRER